MLNYNFYLLLLSSFFCSCLYADVFNCDGVGHPLGWQKGELVYEENFNSLKDWQPEGNIEIANLNGQLKIQTYGDSSNNKGTVWSRKEFIGPYYIEWKFKEADSSSLNLMFWGARPIEGTDFFSPARDHDFGWVVDSNVESYHLSYSRGGTGWSHVHKNPGFHDLVPEKTIPDPLRVDDGEWHTIGIYQQSGHILIYVDSILIHDIDENADYGECFVCNKVGRHRNYKSINHCDPESFCPGLNAKKNYVAWWRSSIRDKTGRRYLYMPVEGASSYSYTSGRIGFRHQRGASIYDDLKIWSLVRKDSRRSSLLNGKQ